MSAPLTDVVLVVLRQPICHDCGWQGELTSSQAEADLRADHHDCARDNPRRTDHQPGEMRAWRDSNSRPLHP